MIALVGHNLFDPVVRFGLFQIFAGRQHTVCQCVAVRLIGTANFGSNLASYNQNKIVSLSYDESQLLIGFDFTVAGSTSFDLGIVEDFLHSDVINLPTDVTVETSGDIELGGSIHTDFAVGFDLGDLETGITFDDLLIQLNDLTLDGTLSTPNLDVTLGYGPLTGSITDAAIGLEAGIEFRLDNSGSTTATLRELIDQGFSLLDVAPTKASLSADLPVSVALHDVTAAETELMFHSDDLFGELSDLVSRLPSLNDIANLSIDEIIDGIKKAVDFIEQEALAHPQTVAEMPLLNDYLDTALADIRAGLQFVEDLEGAQSQVLWHNAVSGTVLLQFDGDTESFQLDFGTPANPLTVDSSTLQNAISQLMLIQRDMLTVEVTGDGTVDSPWKVRFKDGNTTGSVDVPTLVVVDSSNLLLDSNSAAATLTVLAPDAQSLWHNGATGTLQLRFENDAEPFTLDFGSDLAPLPVDAQTVRDAIAKLALAQHLEQRTVEVTGEGTELDPWQVRFATYELSHNGLSGLATLQLAGESDSFAIDLGSGVPLTASALQAELNGLNFVTSQGLTVEVLGDGSTGNPWQIMLTDANGSHVVLPDIEVLSNTLTDAQGVPASVTLATTYDSTGIPDLEVTATGNQLLTDAGAQATAEVAGPTADNVSKELAVAERFLERVLEVDETQFLTIWTDSLNGSGDVTLQVASAADPSADQLSLANGVTTGQLITALQNWDAFNPGGVATVAISGIGTEDDPWIVTMTGAGGSGVSAPDLEIASSTLLNDVGKNGVFSIESDRPEHVDLLLQGTSVILDLGKDFAFNDPNFSFAFDLSHLAANLPNGIPQSIRDALNQVGKLTQLSANGVVDVDLVGRIDFRVGFNPNKNLGESVFVTDDSQVTFEILLDAHDLDFDIQLDVDDALKALPQELQNLLGEVLMGTTIDTVGLHVKGGSVQLNAGEDQNGDPQRAVFNFGFASDNDSTAGGEAGNGRYSLLDGGLSGKLVTNHLGNLLVDLPVFFPTVDLPMGGTENDRNGDGIGDNVLQVQVDDLNAVEDSMEVSAPHFANSISLFSLLNNIDIVTVIAGPAGDPEKDPFKDGLLGTLQDVLSGDIFGVPIPFIGDKLKTEADFIGKFRHSVRSALDALANPANEDDRVSTVDVVQGGLFEIFHDILHILPDNNGDGVIDANDIAVSGGRDFVQFDVQIAGDLARVEVPIDVSANILPGLGINFGPNDTINLDVSYNFSFGFGFSIHDGFYFDTSSPGELELDIEAVVSEGFSAKVDIAGLELTVLDLGTTDLRGNDSGSGLFGRFYIDVMDTGAGMGGVVNDRLTLSEIFADSPDQNGDVDHRANIVDAGFQGKADFNFEFSLGLQKSNALPHIVTEFVYAQDFGLTTSSDADPKMDAKSFGGVPTIEFRNVELDLGKFLQGIAGDAIKKINQALDPIKPIINLLTAKVPVVSDLASHPISFIELAEAFGGSNTKPFFEAIDTIVTVSEFFESFGASGGTMINFGNFVVGGDGSNLDIRDQGVLKDADKMGELGGSATGFNDSMLNQSVAQQEQGSGGSGLGGILSKLRHSGISLPFLTSPSSVFSLIAGDFSDIDFFQWDMPRLDLRFDMRESFPVFPGLNAFFGGALDVIIDFTFGYDSSGIELFVSNGKSDAVDLSHGFYISDFDSQGVDNPELSFVLTIDAGASLGIGGLVRAGVDGGLQGILDLNLHNFVTDTSDPDYGLLRLNELINVLEHEPQCLFDAHGELDVFLEAFLWVGLNLGFSKITLFDKHITFLRETLASFDYHCDYANEGHVDAHLASLVGGELTLGMGPNAAIRNVNNGETAEAFTVTLVDNNATVRVSAFGQRQDFEAASVTKIIADGGSDVDIITLGKGLTQELDLGGGAGDDIIFVNDASNVTITDTDGDNMINVTAATGDVTITTGGGNDVINVNKAGGRVDVQSGGGDDGVTVGAAGADVVVDAGANVQQDGADRVEVTSAVGGVSVMGGAGDDILTVRSAASVLIRGDAGDDQLTGTDASDLIFGGAGVDRIFAGPGNDIVFGDQVQDANGTEILDLAALPFGFADLAGDKANILAAVANQQIVAVTLGGGSPAGSRDTIWGDDGNDAVFAGDEAVVVDPFTGIQTGGDQVFGGGRRRSHIRRAGARLRGR